MDCINSFKKGYNYTYFIKGDANMNPLNLSTKDVEAYFYDWNKLYPKSYNKTDVSPFTKVRIILMNGTEFESNWFLHQFARNCDNQDLLFQQ
jgi:hypothetical protein